MGETSEGELTAAIESLRSALAEMRSSANTATVEQWRDWGQRIEHLSLTVSRHEDLHPIVSAVTRYMLIRDPSIRTEQGATFEAGSQTKYTGDVSREIEPIIFRFEEVHKSIFDVQCEISRQKQRSPAVSEDVEGAREICLKVATEQSHNLGQHIDFLGSWIDQFGGGDTGLCGRRNDLEKQPKRGRFGNAYSGLKSQRARSQSITGVVASDTDPEESPDPFAEHQGDQKPDPPPLDKSFAELFPEVPS